MFNPSLSIRDIAARQPSAVALLQRFEIDVCALADKSLREACSELQLSLGQVSEKLQECHDVESSSSDPAALSNALLIQHIVRIHHQRIRRDLPSLIRYAQKITEKDGEHGHELKAIEKLIEQLQLFPRSIQMESELRGGK